MRLMVIALIGACGTSEPSPKDVDPSWTLLADEQPAALLSVWGSGANDVWVVGGRSELDGAPTVLHYRDEWIRVDAGVTGSDLWAVFGFDGGDVFFAGANGTIVRYRDGAFAPMATPRTGTIFGLWGTGPEDVWAVGDGGAAGAIVWHFDGASWSEPTLPAGVSRTVFKVHGQGPDDVWMSCADGSVLHWNGAAIEREPTGGTMPLFSIVTTPQSVVAAGGFPGEGVLVERTAQWASPVPAVPVRWRGLAVDPATGDGTGVYAVGERGFVARREAGMWNLVDQQLTQGSFHAAWIDDAGGLWAVGGDFERAPLTASGVFTYFGTDAITEIER